MKIRKGFLLLFILTFLTKVVSYGQKSPYLPYIDKGEKDSLIRSYVNNISNSYYVFVYPTGAAITSWGGQFIAEYRRIIQSGIRKPNEDILIVFDDEIIPLPQIPTFMKKMFGLKDNELNSIKYVVSKTLFNSLKKGDLVGLLYFHERKLVYENSTKYNSIVKVANKLPHSPFSIHFIEKTPLPFDTLLIKSNDFFKVTDDGYLILFSDFEHAFLCMDITAQKIVRYKKLNDIIGKSAEDLYCEYIATNTALCEYAKQNNQWLKYVKRKQVDIFWSWKYNHVKQTIEGILCIEIAEANDKTYTYKNEDGEKTTLFKGEPISNVYLFYVEIDKKLNLRHIKYIPDAVREEGKNTYYSTLDAGFIVQDSLLISTQFCYRRTKSCFTKNVLTCFDIKKQIVSLVRNYSNIYAVRCTSKKEYQKNNIATKTFFIQSNNSLWVMFDSNERIYDVKKKKPIVDWSGNPSVEKYKKEIIEVKDSEGGWEKAKLNFEFHDVASIYDGQYIAAFYLYVGQPYVEFKDASGKTIQLIEIKHIPHFDKYKFKKCFNVHIQPNLNRIYFIAIENNVLYLYSFEIKLNYIPVF